MSVITYFIIKSKIQSYTCRHIFIYILTIDKMSIIWFIIISYYDLNNIIILYILFCTVFLYKLPVFMVYSSIHNIL